MNCAPKIKPALWGISPMNPNPGLPLLLQDGQSDDDQPLQVSYHAQRSGVGLIQHAIWLPTPRRAIPMKPSRLFLQDTEDDSCSSSNQQASKNRPSPVKTLQ
jgi:hypothetical protein